MEGTEDFKISNVGMLTGEASKQYDKGKARVFCDKLFASMEGSKLYNLFRVRDDLITWRRGSAQMVLRVNHALDNVTFYSVLVTGIEASMELFRRLLHYNTLQRRESLGLFEQDDNLYIVLKYTMELLLVNPEVLMRHVFTLQEVADYMDTDLVNQFGGSLQFEDWGKVDQNKVDQMLSALFE